MNKRQCRLNRKLPPRLRDGAVLYQRKRREIANREIAGEEWEDAEQEDGSTIFLDKKILELLLELAERPSRDTAAGSAGDALCTRRDGGSEGYDNGLEGESGDDEGL
jgi:hypothetical protein